MTLKAFVREQVETGKELPFDLFGVYIANKNENNKQIIGNNMKLKDGQSNEVAIKERSRCTCLQSILSNSLIRRF